MAIRLHEQTTFGRDSNVLSYWLAHSEGFRVRSRRGSAIVEGVYVEPPCRVVALAVRGRLLRRRRLIPASSIERVVPARQLLVTGRPVRDQAHVEAARLVRLAGRGARAAAPRLRRLGLLLLHTALQLLVLAYAWALRLGLRFAAAVDGDVRARWVGTTKRAGQTVGTGISRSCSSAIAGASAARDAARARARGGRFSSPPSFSSLSSRARRSLARRPPRD